MGRAEPEVRAALERARAKLRAARDARPTPFVDRTRYTNWNAMMASAMLRAGTVLGDEEARRHALLTLGRLRDERVAEDAVAHTPGGVTGLLDDQVQVAAAALDAHEVTGELGWLTWAVRLMDRVWADYWDEEGGGLFDTARGRSSGPGLLPATAKPVQDTPTPSPNGVAGIVCARLHELTGEARWRERGLAVARAFAGRSSELGLYAAAYLLALDWQLAPSTHLVIVGEPGDPVADRMHADALALFVPRRVVRRIAPAEAASQPLPPAMAGMVAAGRAPRAYACTGHELPGAGRDSRAMAGGAGGAAREPGLAGPPRLEPSSKFHPDVEGVRLTLTPSDAQRRAIQAPLGPVLVVAGPGAGKTYCLIARIGHLIACEGLSPARICAVTFTNKAADEIATRLRREIGPAAEEITRGTLHSLCFSLLRDYAAAAGLRRGIGIADEDYQRRVLRRLRVRSERQKQLLQLFGRHRLQHVPLTAGDLELFQAYSAALTSRNLVDYDDLIARTGELLREHPAAGTTSGAAGTTCWWTSSRT